MADPRPGPCGMSWSAVWVGLMCLRVAWSGRTHWSSADRVATAGKVRYAWKAARSSTPTRPLSVCWAESGYPHDQEVYASTFGLLRVALRCLTSSSYPLPRRTTSQVSD
jgi:hypothetical protein